MYKKIRAVGVAALVLIWAALTALAWLSPAEAESDAERRKLKQFPDLSWDTVLETKFMSEFDKYTLDQFPMRNDFRQIKALFHRYVLQQKDNNEVYLADGHFSKLDYPVDTASVDRATGIFNNIYNKHLKDAGCRVFMATVPDKGYYLGAQNGFPVMDFEEMFLRVQQNMPWATHVDLTDCLTLDDYYRTDTHWRQERLIPVAQKLAQAMDLTVPQLSDYTQTVVDKPFYGVYYGQAALPADSETIVLMENQLLSDCKVFNYETDKYTSVYDSAKLNSKDLYEIYLSGPQSILRIENPHATTERDLVVFRDSFGSSLTPLLVQDYETVTLVDVRYVPSASLERYLTFDGQDVLFLYSTMVLNDSTTLR